MSPPELLYYALGKGSSYGHVSRSKDHIRSMTMVDAFLTSHAEAECVYTFRIKLSAELDKKDREERQKIFSTITSYVGPPSEIYGDNTSVELNAVVWLQRSQLPPDLKMYLVSLSVEAREFCSKYLSIAELTAFYWKELDLPQNLLVTMISHDKFSLQPNFWFPDAINELEFYKLMTAVTKCLPVRFTVKHFKKAIPTKSGKKFNFRAMDDGVIAKITALL